MSGTLATTRMRLNASALSRQTQGNARELRDFYLICDDLSDDGQFLSVLRHD